MTGDIIRKTDLEDIRQSIILLLHTRYYDRKWQPKIGSPFPDTLYSQNDNITRILISDTVKKLLKDYEPRITNVNVDCYQASEQDLTKGIFRMKISYEVPFLETYDIFDVVLEKIR